MEDLMIDNLNGECAIRYTVSIADPPCTSLAVFKENVLWVFIFFIFRFFTGFGEGHNTSIFLGRGDGFRKSLLEFVGHFFDLPFLRWTQFDMPLHPCAEVLS